MMRRCREYDIAFGLLEEGIRTIETTGERMFEAELYRLLGELELEVGRGESGKAALTTATAVARRQHARLWKLRAAVVLARHWGENGNMAGARDVLAPVYWLVLGRARHCRSAASEIVVRAAPLKSRPPTGKSGTGSGLRPAHDSSALSGQPT
jgi:predicted ATPase